jgi:hypothetical protein
MSIFEHLEYLRWKRLIFINIQRRRRNVSRTVRINKFVGLSTYGYKADELANGFAVARDKFAESSYQFEELVRGAEPKVEQDVRLLNAVLCRKQAKLLGQLWKKCETTASAAEKRIALISHGLV